MGVKNIQAGIGCGVGFGHGFGVGMCLEACKRSELTIWSFVLSNKSESLVQEHSIKFLRGGAVGGEITFNLINFSSLLLVSCK